MARFKRREYLKDYPPACWAVDQVIRFDRNMMVEDVCMHGVGHPNRVWLKKNGTDGDEIHGCCGCCCKDGSI